MKVQKEIKPDVLRCDSKESLTHVGISLTRASIAFSSFAARAHDVAFLADFFSFRFAQKTNTRLPTKTHR